MKHEWIKATNRNVGSGAWKCKNCGYYNFGDLPKSGVKLPVIVHVKGEPYAECYMTCEEIILFQVHSS